MAQPSQPVPVKLICALLSAREDLIDLGVSALVGAFGPVDDSSRSFPFDQTRYYDEQMGSPLRRRLVSFERLVSPDTLAGAKLRTNQMEADFARQFPAGPPRPINLDIGYIEPSKLVLASMKNFAHRIYLWGGVYAEVTLQYRQGNWERLPWTFPDFASGRYDAFLTAARDRLRAKPPAP